MTTILLYILTLLLLAYSWQLILIRRRWQELKIWSTPPGFKPSTKVSVLLPVRNEAPGIEACLTALAKQNLSDKYFDIHLIDDHSEDQTLEIARQAGIPNLHIHQLPVGESGKKAALAMGVRASTGTLIMTTDGDCIADPGWISTTLSYYEQTQSVMICGAVSLEPANSLFTAFQALDFSGMMAVSAVGVTSGQIRLCNGANLAFDRTAFLEVGAYEGIDQIPSGDDVLLLDKMENYFPGKVSFLKQHIGIVRTVPMPDWRTFLLQRIRWAAKTTTKPHWPSLVLSGLVFGTCLAVFISFLLIPVYGIFPFLLFFSWKTIIDFFFLSTMARFFGRSQLLNGYFMAQIFHLVYWISVGFASLLMQKVNWKGRRVSLK
ncbi:MAG: glycosyltransferase [Saprospiraceae bacterium]|nr:glycosyltransferase [Saprospiraceae bacterium]